MHRITGWLAAFALSAVWVGESGAQGCAPEKLLKIVTTADQPGMPTSSFAAQPKTIWRWRERYVRLEELPNPETKVHLLAVIHEPDIWIVNRLENKGRHLVDPGPRFVTHLPLFAELTEGIWPGLEFGCEPHFFRTRGAVALHEETGIIYLLKEGNLKVRLFTDLEDRPVRAEAERGDFKRGVDYLSYETLPTVDMKLFEKPAGVEYEPAAPTPETAPSPPSSSPPPPSL